MRFKDRTDAGKQLAKKVQLNEVDKAVVLALPRGGIPLGVSIANEYDIPLDVVLAKKITHPMHPEFAIGAVAEGGEPILNDRAHVKQEWIDAELPHVRAEIKRRRDLYDQVLTKQSLKNKEVLIVDDGIATGMTVLAAIQAVKQKQAKRITVAVPIIPRETFVELDELVDDVYYVEIPKQFLGAVGAYYQHFPQLSDDKVTEILRQHPQ